MPRFLLLLHDDPTQWTKLSPQEMQKVMLRYRAWGEKAAQQKFKLAGQKLADEPGKVLRSRKGKLQATDGPYSETKEVLGGYYLIEAASYEQAVERCRDHPHLDYGTIEVREVDSRTAEDVGRSGKN
jgi:hypothetical protein